MLRSSEHRALLSPLRTLCLLALISLHTAAAFSTAISAFALAPPKAARLPGTSSLCRRRGFGLQMINFPNLNLNFGGAEKSTSATREECKRKLLTLISNSKQGKQQTPEEKSAIFTAMRELEALNVCDAPVESELLSGKWSLLYTGAAEEDVATRRAQEGVIGSMVTEVAGASDAQQTEGEAGEERPLGRRITSFANSLVQNKGNFQDIEAERGYVENRARFTVGGVGVELTIEGRCERVEEPGLRSTRLAVFFQHVRLAVRSRNVLRVPLTWLNSGTGPVGWVETTYLDETMRLGRGDKGSFFVTVRRT